jgi:hypothetical protein
MADDKARRPVVGYMMEALKEVLGTKEGQYEAMEAFKQTPESELTGEPFSRALAKFFTEWVKDKAEAAREQDIQGGA